MAKKEIERIVEIPEGVDVVVNGEEVSVKSNGKELKRKFNLPNISMEKKDSTINILSKKGTKREGKLIGTFAAHLNNMIKGVTEGFEYKLEICNVHFPMNVKVEGNTVVVKSFLGETVDRIANIVANSEVKVEGNEIVVSSSEKEAAGQTAANIEKATRLTGRDRRIFQDGIFITEKPGRKI